MAVFKQQAQTLFVDRFLKHSQCFLVDKLASIPSDMHVDLSPAHPNHGGSRDRTTDLEQLEFEPMKVSRLEHAIVLHPEPWPQKDLDVAGIVHDFAGHRCYQLGLFGKSRLDDFDKDGLDFGMSMGKIQREDHRRTGGVQRLR